MWKIPSRHQSNWRKISRALGQENNDRLLLDIITRQAIPKPFDKITEKSLFQKLTCVYLYSIVNPNYLVLCLISIQRPCFSQILPF